MTRRFMDQRHRTFYRIGILFALLTACQLMTACIAPGWLTDAQALIPILASSVTSVLSFIAAFSGNPALSAALAVISPIIQDVSNGLADIESMIQQYKGSPSDTLLQKIEAVAADVSANLNKLLADIGLPVPIAQKIQAWAQLALSQLEAWLAILPSLKAAVANRTLEHMAKPASDRLMRADDLKIAINDIFSAPTGDAEVDAVLANVPKV